MQQQTFTVPIALVGRKDATAVGMICLVEDGGESVEETTCELQMPIGGLLGAQRIGASVPTLHQPYCFATHRHTSRQTRLETQGDTVRHKETGIHEDTGLMQLPISGHLKAQ